MKAILIIPNENKITSLIYFKILKPGEYHDGKEREFAKKNGILLSVSETKVFTPNFIIASNGHIVFEIDGEDIVGYLPEIITKRQRKIMNLLKIKWLLESFKEFVYSFIIDEEVKIKGKLIGFEEIYSFLNETETQELRKLKKR